MSIVQSDQWEESLQHLTCFSLQSGKVTPQFIQDGHYTSPFRELIRLMPCKFKIMLAVGTQETWFMYYRNP